MASAAPSQPRKGILKKPAAAAAAAAAEDHADSDTEAVVASSASAATHSRRQRAEDKAREIATKHALLLQQRKDHANAIFLAIERLTEFPLERGPAYSARYPAPADAAAFVQLVREFQPGDYDDLIEERNTCGLCGYCLCARPHRTYAGHGTWKLVNTGRKDFGIMPKQELEKWCSPACARRALYIKVQLNETAAWERVGIPDIAVELLEEGEAEAGGGGGGAGNESKGGATSSLPSEAETRLARDLAQLKLNEDRRLARDAQALALERGDVVMAAGADDVLGEESPPDQQQLREPLVDVHIMEKRVLMAPTAPSLETTDGGSQADAHLVTEGYKTRFGEQ